MLFAIHLLGCSCAVRVSLTGGGFRLRFPTFEITIVRSSMRRSDRHLTVSHLWFLFYFVASYCFVHVEINNFSGAVFLFFVVVSVTISGAYSIYNRNESRRNKRYTVLKYKHKRKTGYMFAIDISSIYTNICAAFIIEFVVVFTLLLLLLLLLPIVL